MELHEKVELARWALRRTVERARYLQLVNAQLAARILLRQQADRLGQSEWWMDLVDPEHQVEEQEIP